MLTKFKTFDDVLNFRELRNAVPLPAILRAHQYIIAGIHLAEAQECANWGVRRRETLLAPLIIL